jgi:O-antigen/teichoic acid export membrane protein
VASQDAVVLLASAKYRVAAPLIPTLVAGLLIYAVQVFLTAGLVIKKDTRTVAFVLGIAAVLNIGLNCLMLPRMGIQGAAVATLVSYLCSTLLLAKLSFKVLPLKVQVRSLVAYVAAAAAIAFTVPRLDLHSALGNLFGKSLFALLLYGVLVFALDPRFRLQLKSLHHYFQGKGDIANAV